jgi:hypothetical protein
MKRHSMSGPPSARLLVLVSLLLIPTVQGQSKISSPVCGENSVIGYPTLTFSFCAQRVGTKTVYLSFTLSNTGDQSVTIDVNFLGIFVQPIDNGNSNLEVYRFVPSNACVHGITAHGIHVTTAFFQLHQHKGNTIFNGYLYSCSSASAFSSVGLPLSIH